ncbi:helix-turn-helix domain-containing protein [Rhodococcus ruber]|uniref:Helix-turn-helix domain-containing protein n=1 Tax=Rhodococcus ruber TaxID=1830 RepID=A0ABT4ML67_9NOCA|nr:helix-turn-helix domain-containing protein [Rhodococcus ruber]MCZ4521745.1 helix-turn-helix domain-containing protein [Rhodococcus ruber]
MTSPEAKQHGSLGVARIAAVTGVDKSVVSRALRAMEREGVVIRDPTTRGYRLGWRLPMLVVSTEISDLMHLANKAMHDLGSQFPNTVQSFVILRDSRVFVPYNMANGGFFRDQPWNARGYLAFSTAPGRALLCDYSLADLRQVYPEGFDLSEALATYGAFDRADVIAAAQGKQRYERVRHPLVVEDPEHPIATHVTAAAPKRTVTVSELNWSERQQLLIARPTGTPPTPVPGWPPSRPARNLPSGSALWGQCRDLGTDTAGLTLVLCRGDVGEHAAAVRVLADRPNSLADPVFDHWSYESTVPFPATEKTASQRLFDSA